MVHLMIEVFWKTKSSVWGLVHTLHIAQPILVAALYSPHSPSLRVDLFPTLEKPGGQWPWILGNIDPWILEHIQFRIQKDIHKKH